MRKKEKTKQNLKEYNEQQTRKTFKNLQWDTRTLKTFKNVQWDTRTLNTFLQSELKQNNTKSYQFKLIFSALF